MFQSNYNQQAETYSSVGTLVSKYSYPERRCYMMTDMEHDVHVLIKKWYRSIDDPYFDHKPWHHLYDEEMQMDEVRC